MPEVRKVWISSRKHIINIVIFLAGILVTTAAWPADRSDTFPELLGGAIIISSCFLMLYLFLFHFRAEILEVNRKTLFIVLIIVFFIIVTRIVVSLADPVVLLLIPFAIIPIIICAFFDARLALFTLMITLMLAGFIVPSPFEFVFVSFISGVAAIFSLTNIYRPGKLIFASVAVVLSSSLMHFAAEIANGSGNMAIEPFDYELYLANGILILLCYPVIFLFERKFYFLSDTTLLELSNLNHPLMRLFAEEAPGSFQHSLQVANLAEEAARVAGANPLLARVGSLYHDIGKIVNSGYFIENQFRDRSPHVDLDPLESSKIIINHVIEGVLIARKYKLPVQIIDFIRTHHGTTKAWYFYMKYIESDKVSSETEKCFVYPGPRPFSRETAIVMMADAVEAASRTLEKFSEPAAADLIERIISGQEQEDQFSDSPLTFRDLTEIKLIFRKRLLTIHHVRTAYPAREQTGG